MDGSSDPLGGVMQLGRKLSEGFAVDLEADVLEQPPVEAPVVDVVAAAEVEQVEQPVRV